MSRELEKLSRLEIAKRGMLIGFAWGLAIGMPVGVVLQKLFGT